MRQSRHEKPFIAWLQRLSNGGSHGWLRLWHRRGSIERRRSVRGRYVRVQLSGTDYLNMAEVQVMGRQSPGWPRTAR